MDNGEYRRDTRKKRETEEAVRLFAFRIRTADKNIDEVRRSLQELMQGLDNIVITGIAEDPDIDALPIAVLTDSDFAGSFPDGFVAVVNKINEILVLLNHILEEYGAPI